MPKILLTAPSQARELYYGAEALAGLKRLGEVRINESDAPWNAACVIAAATGCQVIVSDRQTAGEGKIFDALPELAAFVRCAVDIRNVDVAAASRNGVLVTRASPGFVPAVAELALGFMVDLGRRVGAANAVFKTGAQPKAAMGRQLAGSTLGVIGYGAIGKYLAGLGVALGMDVMVCDPLATADQPKIRQTDLDTLLAAADFVVCLAVANERTENLLGAAQFARMKRTAYFVNLARGNLVDEAALEAALRENRIAGAALDVGRAPDQMPSPSLAQLPGVIATPHIGGLTPPAIAHQALETVRQVADIVQGRAPPGAVNAGKATRLARFRP